MSDNKSLMKVEEQIKIIDEKFLEIRESAKNIDNFILKKMVQSVLLPLGLLLDYVKIKARSKGELK